jgi:hypothetical protein
MIIKLIIFSLQFINNRSVPSFKKGGRQNPNVISFTTETPRRLLQLPWRRVKNAFWDSARGREEYVTRPPRV